MYDECSPIGRSVGKSMSLSNDCGSKNPARLISMSTVDIRSGASLNSPVVVGTPDNIALADDELAVCASEELESKVASSGEDDSAADPDEPLLACFSSLAGIHCSAFAGLAKETARANGV